MIHDWTLGMAERKRALKQKLRDTKRLLARVGQSVVILIAAQCVLVNAPPGSEHRYVVES